MGKTLPALMIMIGLVLLAACGPELAPATEPVDAVVGQAQPSMVTPSFSPPSPTDAPPTPALVDHPTVTPIPTTPPVIPPVDITPVSLHDGQEFSLVTMSPESAPPGNPQPCGLDASPDGKWVAISMCNSEGREWLYIRNTEDGHGFRASIITQFDLRTPPSERQALFRGWFPDSTHILVMTDWLEIMNIETGESRAVTPDVKQPGHRTVTDAAVAPDGQTIVYTDIQGDALYLIDDEGKELATVPRPVPSPGDRPENLVWSPDGKWIAYTWDQGKIFGAGPLWLSSASGDKTWQVSLPGTYESMISWSPDSSQVLVTRFADINDLWTDYNHPDKWVSDLWFVSIASGEWSQLTQLEGMAAWLPVGTPDGLAVVFMSNQSGQPEAWMINTDGGGLQQLTFDGQIMPLALDVIP